MPLDEPNKKNVTPASDPAAPRQEIVPPQIAKVLPQLPPEAAAVVFEAVMHSGPIPPAEFLASYPEDIQRKIVEWADNQHKHRIELENLTTHGNESRMNRGQWMTAGIAFSSVVAAAVVGVLTPGNWLVPAIIVAIGVGGPSVAATIGHALGHYMSRTEEKTPDQGSARTKPKPKNQRGRRRGNA